MERYALQHPLIIYDIVRMYFNLLQYYLTLVQNYKSSSIIQIALDLLCPKTEKFYFFIDSFKQIVSGTLLEKKEYDKF